MEQAAHERAAPAAGGTHAGVQQDLLGRFGGGGSGGGGSSSVTYTELMDGNSGKGVFAKSCVACHSGGNPQGGLDITNYSQAKTYASQIKSSVDSGTMPRGRTLSPGDIQTIDTWVTSGTPQ